MRERTSNVCSLVLTGMLAMVSSAATAQVTFEDLSFEAAQQKAQKEGKIIFVDVMRGDGVPEYNKRVEEEVFTIDSVTNFFRGNCVSIRIDMGSAAGKAFGPNLNMLMYPAYVFYDAKGAQLEFTNAYNVVNKPAVLMEKARASSAIAEVKKANTRAIRFDNRTWSAILEEAKSSGKLIFLDAQTEWCRPCRMMERDVFTLDTVADFYNSQFINVSMDMEGGEGPELVKKYAIQAYPTYLFIDGTGKVVHRDGGFMPADSFLAVGKKALATRGEKVNQAVAFIENTSWETLLERAQTEDKLIFLDGYAVWCGPCKTMDRTVFSRDDVGCYFNTTFLNVKRDMEKGEGALLKIRYDIKAYPTYLFINGKGEEVHRIVGSAPVDEFMADVQIALQPQNQLASLDQRYAEGERSLAFIQQYLHRLSAAYMLDRATEVATAYLEALPPASWFTISHWTMANEYLANPNSGILSQLAVHRDKLREIGVENADEAVENLYSKGFYQLFRDRDAYDASVFHGAIQAIQEADLPHADELIRLGRLLEASKAGNWKSYHRLLDRVVEKGEKIYGQNISVSVSMFASNLLRETGTTYVDEVLKWADTLLPTLDNALDRAKLYDLKQLAYQQAGDEKNAASANAQSKALTTQWNNEHQGAGMMMAIPMKLK